jgi:glycerate kinase
MKIVIAVDKFKGSLTAAQVAAHLSVGLHAVDPDIEVLTVPVADGGEGTFEAAIRVGYQAHPVRVTGAAGSPINAAIAIKGTEAIIEMSMASGLQQLQGELMPLRATSYGTGELIRAALDQGCQRIILGVGGSACTDAGAGLLQALGMGLFDANHQPITFGGAALANVATITLDQWDARLANTEFILASDVDNPLLGERGAAAVFAPQKGASAQQVAILDAALNHFVTQLTSVLGESAQSAALLPGAGAAGGVGYAALAAIHARYQSGIALIQQLTGLPAALQQADLVITGEGSLDQQSLGGKTPLGVANAANRAGVPVIAVCGISKLSRQQLQEAGFIACYSIRESVASHEESMKNANTLLEQIGRNIAERHSQPTRQHAVNESTHQAPTSLSTAPTHLLVSTASRCLTSSTQRKKRSS